MQELIMLHPLSHWILKYFSLGLVFPPPKYDLFRHPTTELPPILGNMQYKASLASFNPPQNLGDISTYFIISSSGCPPTEMSHDCPWGAMSPCNQ